MAVNPLISAAPPFSVRAPVGDSHPAGDTDLAYVVSRYMNRPMLSSGGLLIAGYPIHQGYFPGIGVPLPEAPLMSPSPAISQELPFILEWRLSRLESETSDLKSLMGRANRVLDETLGRLSSTTDRNAMLVHSIGLSGELLLRSPISVLIEEDEGQMLAEAPEFQMVGEGATEPEAVTDVMIQLKDLYDDLMATPDEKLGALPKRWKRVLKNLVIDNAPNL